MSNNRSNERFAVPNKRNAVFFQISGRFAFVPVKNIVARQLDAFSMSSKRLSKEPSIRDRHSFRQLSATGREVVGKFVIDELKASNMTDCKVIITLETLNNVFETTYFKHSAYQEISVSTQIQQCVIELWQIWSSDFSLYLGLIDSFRKQYCQGFNCNFVNRSWLGPLIYTTR